MGAAVSPTLDQKLDSVILEVIDKMVHRQNANCTSRLNYNGADSWDVTSRKVDPVKKCNTSSV